MTVVALVRVVKCVSLFFFATKSPRLFSKRGMFGARPTTRPYRLCTSQGYLAHKKMPIPPGPHRRLLPRVLGGFLGSECFLMGEVPPYTTLMRQQ